MTQRLQRNRPHNRRGSAVVEFSIVASLVILLVFGLIEVGRVMMAVQCLEAAAHAGCRTAILRDATTADIDNEVDNVLTPAGITNYTMQTTPAVLSTTPQWGHVTVEITAPLEDLIWLPVPNFFAGKAYQASCTLPREATPN